MTILFTASEVGSVRALIPVIRECYKRDIPFKIIKDGFFHNYDEKYLNDNFIEDVNDHNLNNKLFKNHNVNTVVFSVNLFETLPLLIARSASELGIHTIHILDYWHMYKGRMELDGKETFIPTKYLVPDQYAARLAMNKGFNAAIVEALGHPAYCDLLNNFNVLKTNPKDRTIDCLNTIDNRNLLLFISEPVSSDQHKSRGYTEEDVIKTFIEIFRKIISDQEFYVCVMPHPREDRENLKNIWSINGGDILGHVETKTTSDDLLPFANGVIGMSSTFLYQSWLMNIPVLSIRPNDKSTIGDHLTHRMGLTIIDNYVDAFAISKSWLSNLNLDKQNTARKELYDHIDSDKRIVNLIQSYNKN